VEDRGSSLVSIKPEKLIRLSKSCLSDAEKQAVMLVLDREYLGMGVEVQKFEESLSEFFGRPAVTVVNGTAALHLALQAIGLGQGDEVLVQSLTYVASFQAISATGATPVACDVNKLTLTLDLEDAEKRLTKNTKALMPVHYSGDVGELDEIYLFAEKHNLRVIEDAAHAFGTEYKGKKVGGFGDIACFSFDGIKNITSGEGGCIVTEDIEVLKKIKEARLLGVENDTEKRFSGKRSWNFDVVEQGWRYHMSDLMAAIGRVQLQRFPKTLVIRQKRAIFYDICLTGHTRIEYFAHNYEMVVPHIYVVRIHGLKDRDALRSRLLDRGIQTGIHYQPNHKLTLYQKDRINPLVVTDKVYSELLSLPIHSDITELDVRYICDQLITAIE
jgi:dTDP-4-amino-4,6-dideoxygalactose transaminase